MFSAYSAIVVICGLLIVIVGCFTAIVDSIIVVRSTVI
jgi:hypothetical protein